MILLNPATDFFRKEAKTFLEQLKAKDPASVEIASKIFPDLTLSLMRVQHLVAQKYGFKSWSELENALPIEQRLAITMEKNPILCADGWGVSDFNKCFNVPYPERAKTFEKALAQERHELRINHKAVEETYYWIQKNMMPIKSFNLEVTSYGLKHRAEFEIGYIINGVFIAAALIAGYRVKSRNGSINVHFNMSKKRINEVYDYQNNNRSLKKNSNSMIRP
jgi:hypothetical protein